MTLIFSRRGAFSLTLVAALSVTVATGPAASASPSAPPTLLALDPSLAEPASDPFYTPPAEIPDQPGSLIRSQFAPHLLDALDLGADAPGRADKILYTSTTQDGTPVATSGTVIEPTGHWDGTGPTPTVVFAPGTRGSGDDCAPSRAGGLLASADVSDGTLGPVNLNYEYPFYAAASALGIRVVVADLIGLGTPGQHTYANHTEEGHAVLDAARAGLAAANVPADSPVAFFGYSQGGGAAAGAAELAATYAPELNLKGSFVGAPPAEIESVVGAIDRHMIDGVLGYALNGAIARNPQLAPLADTYFNDEGKRYLASTADECILNSTANWALRDTRTLTKDGRSFGEILRDDEALNSVLLGPDYRLGGRALNAPMMLANGRNDDTIPWSQSRHTAQGYCSLGGQVQFVTDDLPSVLPGFAVNHALPMLTQAGTAFGYLRDRFNNVADVPSNCGQF